MAKRKIGDVLWLALQCAKSEEQSIIDAYSGDESEEVVKNAKSNIRAFSALQKKLFGTDKSKLQSIIDKMKPIDIYKILAGEIQLEEGSFEFHE